MASKKSSSWFGWVILIVLIGGGVFGWRYYATGQKNEAPDYKTNVISRADVIQAVTANGQIVPVKSVTVGTQVSGIVRDVLVDFNSKVTNGQVVAKIDPSTFEQNLAQADAELASANAALEYAQLNHKRAAELIASKLISPSEYEKTVVDLHQAEAVSKTRAASVNKARVDLERTTIYAPIDGVVISRNVDIGQTVASSFNTPTLFQIANDLAKMQIEAMVSEADVGDVAEGQKVNFTVDAFRNRSFRGSVRQVRYAPITNQNVVNYCTVVDVRNPDFKLRPGMTAGASIVTAQRTNVIRVPNAALNFRPPPTPGAKTNVVGGAKTNVARIPSEGASGEGGADRREEMRKRFESMTPEQREEMRARRASGGGGGGFGGGFGGGASPRGGGDGPVTRTVYLIEPDGDKTKLKPVSIKVGISDGTYSEVVEGLKEADVVAIGINLPTGSAGAQGPGGSPFGRSPFGGGGGPGGGGGGFRPR